MDRRPIVRASFVAFVSLVLSACQGGGAGPPPFNTGNAPPNGQLSASPSSITFSGTGPAFNQTVTITTTAAVSTVNFTSTCGSGPTAIVSFAPPQGSGVTFTDVVTPVNPGTCTATITSAGGGSATVTFTVNQSSVTVSGRRRE